MVGSMRVPLLVMAVFASPAMAETGPIQVIGAGYGRTGTDSLRTALNILGFNTYHMKEILEVWRPDHMAAWEDFFTNSRPQKWNLEKRKQFFGKVFEQTGFNATVDFPSAAAWDTLMDVYPQAKVILTERDSPEIWWDSVKVTIADFHNSLTSRFLTSIIPSMWPMNPFLCAMWGYANNLPPFMLTTTGKEIAVSSYAANSVRVRKEVAANRLLIFNVKQGWKPLCDFLQLPIPDQPFPRTNSKAEIVAFVEKMHYGLWAILVAAILAVVVVARAIFWFAKKRSSKKNE